MTWVTVGPDTATWSSAARSTVTYGVGGIAASPWVTVSPQADTSDGQDFEVRLCNPAKFLLRNDRPALIQSSLSEGAP